MQWMRVKYNLGLAVLSPVIAVYLVNRYVSGKSRPGWNQRWGHVPLEIASDCRPTVWVHGASAGEVVAAIPVMNELKQRLPGWRILLSVITPAGYEMARKQAGGAADEVFYLPFDFPWVVQSVVRVIHPKLFVTLESELWPNLLYALRANGAKTALINGRKSVRSYQRAKQYASGIFRWMIGNLDLLLMQSSADADRMKQLGEPRSTAPKCLVMGNSKLDQVLPKVDVDASASLRSILHLPAIGPVWVVGSTRSAEEEAIIIRVYSKLTAQYHDLSMIVAPRQLPRAPFIAQQLTEAGIRCNLKSQLTDNSDTCQVLVLDTMGELASVYSLADFAFVGNTFAPVVQGGGQNILQPVAFAKPVLIGPLYATIKNETELLAPVGAVTVAANEEQLYAEALTLLKDPELCLGKGEAGRKLLDTQRGVSARCAALLVKLTESPSL